MTALSGMRANPPVRWSKKRLLMGANLAAHKGGACGFETAANANQGLIVPMTASTTLVFVGIFAEELASAAASQLVDVDFLEELEMRWFANAGAPNNVAAAQVGSLAWFIDDQTVSKTSTSNSLAGRIYAYEATTNRVLVRKLPGSVTVGAVPASQMAVGTAGQVLTTNSDATAAAWADPAAPAPGTDLPAFAANDSAPTAVVSGKTYAVPNTGAASTVTLPAAAPDGTEINIIADGTANGHTVQYRDATGPTNLTTALTASKRHLVVAVKRSGKWYANAYVSP